MKKALIILSLFALAFVGCTKDDHTPRVYVIAASDEAMAQPIDCPHLPELIEGGQIYWHSTAAEMMSVMSEERYLIDGEIAHGKDTPSDWWDFRGVEYSQVIEFSGETMPQHLRDKADIRREESYYPLGSDRYKSKAQVAYYIYSNTIVQYYVEMPKPMFLGGRYRIYPRNSWVIRYLQLN